MRSFQKNIFLTATLVAGITLAAGGEIKVGGNFPDLAAQKLEGKLPDSIKDKVVIVDFWASWCTPCAQSFPVMEELQKKYGPRGLVIIAVSVDDNKGDMDSFLKKRAVSFFVVRDPKQKFVEKTGIAMMPSSFVLGRDGKVAYVHSGFRGAETKKEYEHDLEALLKDPPK